MKTNVTIDDFFENTNILITGATGFIGKVLIEKLLRSQSTINNLFLLIRSKKGKNVTKRADEIIFNQPLFEGLKKQNPCYKDKVAVIEGDILQPELGLSEENNKKLISQINIVFHCAASVNMVANLKFNVRHNVESVFELLKLCRQMNNLKSVVLVSTAYSNCNRSTIEEKIYEPSLSPELVIRMCKEIDDNALEGVTKLILNGHPNTYTFTKSLLESAVRHYKDLPIVLFRPAIVVPSYSEPVPGWVDNKNGPMGGSYLGAMGILRVTHCPKNIIANWVPVDYCTNALICSAWHGVQSRYKNENQIMVYNYAFENMKKTWRARIRTLAQLEIKVEQSIWKQSITFVQNKYLYLFLRFTWELIPAVFVDMMLALSGNKFRLTRLYKEKIYPQLDCLDFFACNGYTFTEANVYGMWKSLSSEEKERYPFDSTGVDFDRFMRNFAIGIKVYLGKDKLEDNYKAVKRQRILAVIHYAFLAVFWSGAVWILYNLFKFLFRI